MASRRLAFVLSTGPARGDMVSLTALARAARKTGAEVQVFLVHEGIGAALARLDWLRALIEDGCDVTACATTMDEASDAALPAEVVRGSQDDHAAMVRRAQRLVAFT